MKKWLCMVLIVSVLMLSVLPAQARVLADDSVSAVSMETAFSVFRYVSGVGSFDGDTLAQSDVTCDMTVDMQDAYVLFANASGEDAMLPFALSYSSVMQFDTGKTIEQPTVTVQRMQYQTVAAVELVHNWNVKAISEIVYYGQTIYIKLLVDEAPAEKTGQIEIEFALLPSPWCDGADVRVLTYSDTKNTVVYPAYGENCSKSIRGLGGLDETQTTPAHHAWLIRTAEESERLVSEGWFLPEELPVGNYSDPDFFENYACLLIRADERMQPDDLYISDVRMEDHTLIVETTTLRQGSEPGEAPLKYHKSILLWMMAEDAAGIDNVETVRYTYYDEVQYELL